MFGIGFPELIIILIVALLVVGPSKLPELAKSLGKAFGEFKKMADDVKDTLEEDVMKEEDEQGAEEAKAFSNPQESSEEKPDRSPEENPETASEPTTKES